MKKFSILFLSVMLISGCATGNQYIWKHYSKSQSEVDADVYDCQYKAKMLAASSVSNPDSVGAAVVTGWQKGTIIAQEYANCMRSKGYVWGRLDTTGNF